VLAVAPERIRKWGHRSGALRRTIFLGSCPSTFLALKVQLVVLVSAFVMVSTVWSVYCLQFFHSRCQPYPDICKSGGGYDVPLPALWSRRHCSQRLRRLKRSAVTTVDMYTVLGKSKVKVKFTYVAPHHKPHMPPKRR